MAVSKEPTFILFVVAILELHVKFQRNTMIKKKPSEGSKPSESSIQLHFKQINK
jgi:hypothetical protein